MIYQSDFITDDIDASELYSGLGVKLHGAAMKLIKSSYAEFLHQKEHHPFSIFAVPNDGGFVIRVSALNDEAACIIEGFRKAKRLKIYGIEQPVRIVGENPAPAIRADSAGELIRGNSCRMAFVTPAMFKSQGRVCCFPEIERYFYSVICKFSKFEGAELSYDEFCEAFAAGETGDFQLRERRS